MKLTCCPKPEVNDLTNGFGDHRHLYCIKCRSHFWMGKKYTAKQWEKYING